MNSKASAILEKACEERRRSNFKKAIDRLEEGVAKFPEEFALYTEAIDVGMEAGESLRAIQIFKKAQHKFPDQRFEVWTFAAEKVGSYNDSIMGRFLIEQAVKTGDLAAAASILENLKDHAVSDLLERIRIKKQTMTVARGAGSPGRGEIASFTLTESLLALRLGRLQGAMDGFVEAVGEDPGAAKKIESFLADYENRGDGKGETSFALGCCLAARADYAQALAKLSQAARTAPALAPRAIERIESFGETPDFPVDLRDLTLAQLYLAQGDKARAAGILAGTIARTPGRAADAVDLLRGAVETVDDDLDTQFVFVEAAFAAGRRETALGQLRKIYKDKRHAARLVQWLESRTQSQTGSTEVRLFFAETALNEGLFGKAIEIFKEILERGPQEEAIIRELLSRHQSVPSVRTFYNERFAASREEAKTGEFELERCEGQGFHPRETAAPVERSPAFASPEDGPAASAPESFQTVESLFHQTAAAKRARGDAPALDFENRDFSLTMHEPAAPAADCPPAAEAPAAESPAETEIPAAEAPEMKIPAAAEDRRAEFPDAKRSPKAAPASEPETSAAGDAGGSDLFEYLKRHSEEASGTAADLGLTDATPVMESPAAEAACPEAAPVAETALEAAAPEAAVEPAAPIEEEAQEDYRNFDSLYRAFLAGRLDHARMLEAASLALDERRMDETKRLLSFEPSNLGEDIARKYHLARYHLEEDRPLPALVALRTVHLGSLSREERKDFMLRIAECYRALHNFEAAHGVYLRIMADHPGLPEAEVLARANYARYIETAAGAAPALEKTTIL
jgi:tetratricopeptide (TPR) repeat protein